MSVEQKLDEILQKQGSHDEALNNIMRYLHENLPVKTQQKQTQAKPATDKTVKINNTEVPAIIQELADIREGDGLYILTKPWTPDKGDWMEINNFVKVCGGKWVSAGKDSRWEIPKK